jgi:hypothetical protein
MAQSRKVSALSKRKGRKRHSHPSPNPSGGEPNPKRLRLRWGGREEIAASQLRSEDEEESEVLGSTREDGETVRSILRFQIGYYISLVFEGCTCNDCEKRKAGVCVL